MKWLKNLFKPRSFNPEIALSILDVKDKILVITNRSNDELDYSGIQRIGKLAADKGALGTIIVDDTYEFTAESIETLENVLKKAKEKLSGNPNS